MSGLCPFEEDVLLLADGELPFARRVVVEAHLGVCDACAELEDVLSLAEETLAATEVPELGAVERALDRLPTPSPQFRPYALAAAAAVLVTLAIYPRVRDRAAEPRPSTETATIAQQATAEPTTSAAATALPTPGVLAPPTLPDLPPPVPPAGPTLRRRLAELRPGTPGFAAGVAAVADLVSRRGSRGASALADVLRGTDLSARDRAIDVAAHVDATPVARALGDLLRDPDVGERAAGILARRPDPVAVDALIRDLRTASRPTTIEALAVAGGRDAAEALGERYWLAPAKQRTSLLRAVLRADASVGAALCIEAGAAGPEDAERVRDVVAASSERVLPHLLRFAAGRDTLRARAAARVLGWSRDPAALEELTHLARSPRTADAGVAALLDLGSEASLDAAFDATIVHGADGAVAAAWDGRDVAETHLLAAALSGRDGRRRAAIVLLGRCGGPRAVTELRLERLPGSVHADVVAALGRIGGDDAVSALVRIGSDPALLDDVVVALGRTRATSAVAELARLADEFPDKRVAAVRALGELPSPESVAVLVRHLGDSRAGRVALEALEAMPLGVAVPGLLLPYDDAVPTPVRRALARIAGRDLGSSPAAWRAWWSARS